jgi:hypothetical protein
MRRLTLPDNLGVIFACGFGALLMGAISAYGFGLYAFGFVVVIAVCFYAIAEPERSALALIVLIPFMIVPFRSGSTSVFLGMPFAFVIGLSLMLRCRGAAVWRQPHLYFGFFLLLLVPMVTASIASPDFVRGMTRIIFVIIYGTFAVGLGTAIASERLSERTVVRAFVFGAAVSAVALIGQSLAQFVVGEGRVVNWLHKVSPWFHGNAGIGTTWHAPDVDKLRAIFPFMSPPSAGQYMAVSLIAAIWLMFGGRRTARPGQLNLNAIAIGLIGLALLLTFSRQSWVGALVGLGILVVRAKKTSLVAAAIPILLIVVVLPVPGGGGSFYEYIAHSAKTKSADDRFQLWNQALHTAQANPLYGIGPGQYQSLGADATRAFYAHNVYLDQLVELGYVGGALFLAYGLALLAAAWLRRATLTLAMLASYMAANIFDDTFYQARNGLALAVIVALLGAHGALEVRGPPRRHREEEVPEPAPPPRELVTA